jgi:hypothetical protein
MERGVLDGHRLRADHSPTRTVVAIGLAVSSLAALAIGACSPAPLICIVVDLDDDLRQSGEVDFYLIDLAMSRTAEGRICDPVKRQFDAHEPVPLRLCVERGDTYTSWLTYRIVAQDSIDEHAVRDVLHRVGVVRWPESGVHEERVTLESECRAAVRPLCAEGTQCRDGSCEALPDPLPESPDLLDDLRYRDRGVSCDRTAPTEDVVDDLSDGWGFEAAAGDGDAGD